jgi:hypothetical protein
LDQTEQVVQHWGMGILPFLCEDEPLETFLYEEHRNLHCRHAAGDGDGVDLPVVSVCAVCALFFASYVLPFSYVFVCVLPLYIQFDNNSFVMGGKKRTAKKATVAIKYLVLLQRGVGPKERGTEGI